jgi:transcriptional regulator with XRE-family HTH domain
MLNGSELGDAIRLAMEMKGVKQRDVAEEFGISQPSVSEWLKFGRVDKRHINHLVAYFADVVSPEHWGLGDVLPDTGPTSEPALNRYTSETPNRVAVISANLAHPEAALLLRMVEASKLPGVTVEVKPWIEPNQAEEKETEDQQSQRERRVGRSGVVVRATRISSKKGAA